jgi:hypothetical protein
MISKLKTTRLLNRQLCSWVYCALVLFLPSSVWAIGGSTYISTSGGKDLFTLSASGKSTTLFISSKDYPGVIRASKDLKTDIGKVTDTEPAIAFDELPPQKEVVIVGTLGKSAIIDQLVKNNILDVKDITGKWETFIIQTVKKPLPGVDKALVIAGSDKRGTIYGVYDLSEQIGVSPWYWWADVPAKKQKNLYVKPGRYSLGTPAVKYRGIFIDNEAPAFSGWAKEKFGGANSKVYTKIFELILRLKGNYLWPAMWGIAFNDDDSLNRPLADEYGIVMGTSHHEPMDRAQQEWKRYGKGEWNYNTNGEVLRDFWRKGIENMGNAETIITMGMRGDGDMPMEAGTNIALLERIVADQRKILTEVTGKKPEDIAQLWALYTEVQKYYDLGMRVPDDITLVLCDDNFGNIRRLPNLTEPKRAGGYGLYYHYDFNGGPWSHKWINTVQITKTWEQLHLAYEHNVDRIWKMNVGDLKPLEFPISFYFDYAWNPDKWPVNKLQEYTRQWAQQQFGPQYAAQIEKVITQYSNFNGIRKPELMVFNKFSLIDYREFETIVTNYHKLQDEAMEINTHLPSEDKDAYFQMVLHPIQAVTNLYDLYYALARNRMCASQGRASTNAMSDKVKEYFIKDSVLSHYYNKELQHGKWNHMMDQTHISYTYWRGPEADTLPKTIRLDLKKEAAMGVVIEGSDSWWPNETKEAVLPKLNSYQDTSYYIEVFNQGIKPFTYSATASVPWVKVMPSSGNIDQQERLWVSVDWAKAPKGEHCIPLTITGPENQKVIVQVPVDNSESKETLKGKGFIESNGYVSISAANYTCAANPGNTFWQILGNYGRTSTGITLFPATISKQEATNVAPHLEYLVNLSDTGNVKVQAYLAATIDYSGGNGLHYAVAFDDECPHVINSTLKKQGEPWVNDNSEKVMMDDIRIEQSIHKISKKGLHTLTFWIIDKGVVLEKLVIDCGGVEPSELGPPESSSIK